MDHLPVAPGQIITFYSYKGGAGRSMAVANCAVWIVRSLPARPRRVLVMDWDLEAPGLHRYFAETSERPENHQRPGIINYFAHIQNRLRADPPLYDRVEQDDGWKVFADDLTLDEYLVRDVVEGVDFVKAGRFDVGYAELISTFNWVEFYNEHAAVFPALRDFLRRTYDFCLIDSRTGLNDVSGICTMLLPERLVAVFTPNRQSISGVLDLAARAADYRLGSADPRTLAIFPLPSRIENAELALREAWQVEYQRDFEAAFKSIYKLDACDLTAYFDDVQLPHTSFYSYGEQVALLKEERSGALSLSRAYELFFDKLIRQQFPWELKTAAPAGGAVEAAAATELSVARSPGRSLHDLDVFISYAHIDDVAVGSEQGWVAGLHRFLQIRLAQRLGQEVTIWRDAKLNGSDFFGEAIVNRLASAGVFVAIITPGYVRSEACMRELTEFYRLARERGNLHDGRSSRIFKVVKTPVPDKVLGDSEAGKFLETILGYQFYELAPDARAREFTPDGSGTTRFLERGDDLAHDIAAVLEEERRGDSVVPLIGDGAAATDIYLAETTFDLDFQRDSLRRELQQRGYRVVPHGNLPTETNALRDAVNGYLDHSRMSVHLVGSAYGRTPPDDPRSVVEIQIELATGRSALARVIWMPIGLQSADPRQRQLVDRLRSDIHAQSGADVLESPIESLKTLLLDRLLRPENSRLAPKAETLAVYLIFDQVDAEAVKPVEDALFEAGFEVLAPVFNADIAEMEQFNRENLLVCEAVLIYYGRTSELWLRTKLREIKKAVGWGRARPMRVQAVLIGEPETPDKQRFRSHESQIIRQYGRFEPGALRPFIEHIERAGNSKNP